MVLHGFMTLNGQTPRGSANPGPRRIHTAGHSSTLVPIYMDDVCRMGPLLCASPLQQLNLGLVEFFWAFWAQQLWKTGPAWLLPRDVSQGAHDGSVNVILPFGANDLSVNMHHGVSIP